MDKRFIIGLGIIMLTVIPADAKSVNGIEPHANKIRVSSPSAGIHRGCNSSCNPCFTTSYYVQYPAVSYYRRINNGVVTYTEVVPAYGYGRRYSRFRPNYRIGSSGINVSVKF